MTNLQRILKLQNSSADSMQRKVDKYNKSRPRSTEEVDLKAISPIAKYKEKHHLVPTDDLVVVKLPNKAKDYSDFEYPEISSGILVSCEDTNDIWIAPDKECYYTNFIFKEDLYSKVFSTNEELCLEIDKLAEKYLTGGKPTKVCYILDNQVLEKYTPYYHSTYPMEVFGLSTPRGCLVKRFDNRFRRDSEILRLEEQYNSVSSNEVNKVLQKELKPDEAIIISDGSNVLEVSTNSFWYIDDSSILTLTETIIPEDPDQAVLIAEVRGALNALKMCMLNGRKKITYYFDNTSIVNCFNNQKTEYINDVKEFKDLIVEMDKKGYQIDFLEVHPKRNQEYTEEEQNERKGLNFFHNYCDRMCSEVSEVFLKGYKDAIRVNKEEAVKAKDLASKRDNKQNTKRNQKGSNNDWKKYNNKGGGFSNRINL